MEMNIAFRKMLTDIAQLIGENDLKAMKYNCLDLIPKRRQEEIESAFELWEALEERDKLNATNTQFLKYLLQISTESRKDVLKILGDYESQIIPKTGASVISHPTDGGLTREIKFLTEHLGRQWKDLARSLGLTDNDLECIADENPTNLREKIRQSLLLWQKRYQEKATKTALVCALYDSNLVELSEMIQEDV